MARRSILSQLFRQSAGYVNVNNAVNNNAVLTLIIQFRVSLVLAMVTLNHSSGRFRCYTGSAFVAEPNFSMDLSFCVQTFLF